MKIADNIEFDVDTFRGQRAVFQAAPGGGKSTGARLLLEGTYGHFQHLVLDVEDQFHTLRTEKNDYAIIGGDLGDAPLGPLTNADSLALTLLKVGVSTILQIGDLPFAEQRLFIAGFMRGMMLAPRELWHPVIVMLDEAHNYVPEQGVEISSEPITYYATAGRKRGFGAIFATPRLSLFSKDVLGTCANKFLGRIEQSADRRAAADQLGFTPKSQDSLDMQAFEAGEFYCVGPAISKMPVRARLYPAITKAPLPGATVIPTPTSSAIRQALASLSTAAAEAAADVERLKRENAPAAGAKAAPAPTEGSGQIAHRTDPDEIAAAEKRGWDHGHAAGHEKGREEGYAEGRMEAGRRVLLMVQEFVLENADAKPPAIETRVEARSSDPIISDHPPAGGLTLQVLTPSEHKARHGKRSRKAAVPTETVEGITGPQTRFLASLAWWASVGIQVPELSQVAIIAGWVPSGSNARDRATELTKLGLIERPMSGKISLTAAGKAKAPKPPKTTFAESINSIMTSPQRAVFSVLVPSRSSLSMEELATRVGWEPKGSNIRDRLTELAKLDLIFRPAKGFVQITDWVRKSLDKRGATR